MRKDVPVTTVNDMMVDKCGNCKFWRNPGGSGLGDCLRRAPSLDPANYLPCKWPSTSSLSWCGDWRVRMSDRKTDTTVQPSRYEGDAYWLWESQKLLHNLRGWITNGQSEVAVAKIDAYWDKWADGVHE